MGKTTPKVPFFKGSGRCPKIVDYTLSVQVLASQKRSRIAPVTTELILLLLIVN